MHVYINSLLCPLDLHLSIPIPQCRVPVPISAQAPVPPPPVTNVREAMDLLKTDQEKLISGLTHSTLDVNFSEGNAQGMTMLHYAAMVIILDVARQHACIRVVSIYSKSCLMFLI